MPIAIASILGILSFNKFSSNKILATFAFRISFILGSYICYNKKINNNLFFLAAYLIANMRLHFVYN